MVAMPGSTGMSDCMEGDDQWLVLGIALAFATDLLAASAILRVDDAH
jgi:hypothetical protein